MARHGLTAEDGLTQVWFAHKDGRLSGGAAAVNGAMWYVWWARPFTYLYRLPGLRQIEDWVYRWIAQNRYRLPGSTNHCSIDSNAPDSHSPGPS